MFDSDDMTRVPYDIAVILDWPWQLALRLCVGNKYEG